MRWLLIPLLSLLVLSGAAAYGIALNFARDEFDRALYESAYDIAQLSIQAAKNGQPPSLLPREASELILSDKYDKVYYNIRDTTGLLLSGEEEIDAPPPAFDRRKNKDEQFYEDVIAGNKVRVVSIPLLLQTGAEQNLIHIQVAETLNKRRLLAEKILTGLILPQTLLILLAAGIVWFAVKRSLRPLGMLEASVAAMSPADLSPIQAPDAPTEAQPLINAINGLVQRLQAVLDAQNRFIADAAHQLRTPLAGLKAQIALAARQNSPQDMHHSLGQLTLGAERLTHLVNQLLSAARNEPGADRSLQMVTLDLNALAQATTSEWVNAAVKRGIDLGFESAPSPIWIKGDSLRLSELLGNLLDNALRYTPRSSMVTVRVTAEGMLEVEDNGPGIPEQDRERVFERFHRLLGNAAEGSGLGLAIVKEIAQIHGSTVSVGSGPGGIGACFRVKFPL